MSEKRNRIEIKKSLPGAQAKSAHPSPAGPQGQRRLLPPPAPPSCSVECHRASRGRHLDAFELPGLPVASSRTWKHLETPWTHSPPPELPPPSLVLAVDRETAGAPQRSRVTNVAEEPSQVVRRVRRRRLHHCAKGIGPRSSRAATPFVVFIAGRRGSSSKSGNSSASPSKPPLQLVSG